MAEDFFGCPYFFLDEDMSNWIKEVSWNLLTNEKIAVRDKHGGLVKRRPSWLLAVVVSGSLGS